MASGLTKRYGDATAVEDLSFEVRSRAVTGFLRSQRGLVAILLSTMLGVGVGALVGRQVPAVVGTMIWIFVLEPLTGLIDHIVKYTVGQTATALGGEGGGDVLPWGAAFLVMLAWTAVFLVGAVLVDGGRDVA